MNDAEKSKLEQKLKEAAPLINRLGDRPSVLPDHIKARLNSVLDKKFPLAAQQAAEEPAAPTPVHRTAVEQKKAEPSWLEVWRWWIGLATATAAVALVVVLNRPGPNPKLPPVIQVAMLDSVGTVRGTGVQPMELLQLQWKDAKPQEFADATKLKQWQENWSVAAKQTVVKVVYDRDAGELRVSVRANGTRTSEKVFPVKEERELPNLIKKTEVFIRENLK